MKKVDIYNLTLDALYERYGTTLQTLGRRFLVEVDLEKLGKDLERNCAKDIQWFSVVESFIESFDQEKEIVQLLGISQIHVDNPEEKQFYSKSFFKLMDDNKLEEISESRLITRDEYYERLIHQTGESVEAKIRLSFTIDGVSYLFIISRESRSTILQVAAGPGSRLKTSKEILESLSSVHAVEEFNLTLEELSYRLYSS